MPAPIAEEEFVLTATVASAAARAEIACRELNEDPPHLETFEALARQLLRAESVASSRIEGLIVSHRRLARAAFSTSSQDITAQGVLGNIAAMERAVTMAADLTELEPAHLRELHEILFEGTRDEPFGGVFRDKQNWIGGAASTPRNAEFIPPPPELVPELIDDLCNFCNREDVPAVVQAGIAHAQFETIHPFHDGNGRVGRALIHVMLRRREIAGRNLPPVSLALASDADRYVTGLTSWRRGDEEDWLAIFVDAVYRAAIGARGFAEDVTELQEQWVNQAGSPRKNSGARRMIELLPAHPIVNVKTATQLLGGTSERARLAITQLEEAGVLQQTTVGRRNRAWECLGLFDLLDRFERAMGPPDRTPRPTQS